MLTLNHFKIKIKTKFNRFYFHAFRRKLLICGIHAFSEFQQNFSSSKEEKKAKNHSTQEKPRKTTDEKKRK